MKAYKYRGVDIYIIVYEERSETIFYIYKNSSGYLGESTVNEIPNQWDKIPFEDAFCRFGTGETTGNGETTDDDFRAAYKKVKQFAANMNKNKYEIVTKFMVVCKDSRRESSCFATKEEAEKYIQNLKEQDKLAELAAILGRKITKGEYKKLKQFKF